MYYNDPKALLSSLTYAFKPCATETFASYCWAIGPVLSVAPSVLSSNMPVAFKDLFEFLTIIMNHLLPEWKLDKYVESPLICRKWLSRFHSTVDVSSLSADFSVRRRYLKTMKTGRSKKGNDTFNYCGFFFTEVLENLQTKFGWPHTVVGDKTGS